MATDEDILALFDEKQSQKYINSEDSGTFAFDYSNNNGEFTIGTGDYTFVTKWSKASDKRIHAYKDSLGPSGAIARIKAPKDRPVTIDKSIDFSSRARTPDIGDIIIWRNSHGKYAATKIIGIKDDTRGADKDELICEYVIYHP